MLVVPPTPFGSPFPGLNRSPEYRTAGSLGGVQYPPGLLVQSSAKGVQTQGEPADPPEKVSILFPALGGKISTVL